MNQNNKTMRELVEQLRMADAAYYKHDDPIMSDREYDVLYDELIDIERQTGIILSGSPTQKYPAKCWRVLPRCAIPDRCYRRRRPSQWTG